ncbi:MAG: FHA domain-containing protein [Myxococcaceae bacterium]
MGFQLTIAEGKEAGREFVFEQPSVVIGRTSECDVVLYDPGVSRKHARIFAEGDGYFVEDMGSSNGTKVNGEVVKKIQLKDGDAVTLGPVVFNFVGTELEDAPPPPAQEGDGSTRIVDVDQLKRQKKQAALAPKGAAADQLQQMSRSKTSTMQAVSRPRPSNPKVPVSPRPNGANSAKAEAAPAPLARPRPGVPARGNSALGGTPQLSAAERARLRREATGIAGKARLFWAEASPNKRKGVIAGGGVLGLGLLAGIVIAIVNPFGPEVVHHAEPSTLARKPIEESFGHGEDVTFEREDQKIFNFEVNAPGEVVVLLHFQCEDISQGEVRISVNGIDVGLAPPDQMGSRDRAHEILIPPKVVKRGETNTVTFDNTKNPPGHETWKIWNTWIEVAGVPSGTPEELLAQANAAFKRGQKNMETALIGAGNRYQAWRDFRTAWLTLEGHPDPKPDLYGYARDKMAEAQGELDRKCAQLMVEFQGYAAQYDWKSARDTLDHVKEYFPGNDQACAWKADEMRAEYGL